MSKTINYDEKNVGITGYWFATNYGGVASYYSLYQTVKSLGYKPFFIDNPYYIEKEEFNDFPRRFFREVDADICKPYSMDELEQLNQLTDIFMLGSDQVLTLRSIREFGKYFLMGFAKDSKYKIAVSSSTGGDSITSDEDLANYGKELLQRFNKISIREFAGIDLVRNRYGVYADFIIDPIFFTEAQKYQELSQGESDDNKPYMLAYILDPTEDKRNCILKLSNMLGMRIKIVLDGRKFTHEENLEALNLKESTLPELNFNQWIYYYNNASYIFTDSFHGVAMALILNKPFIIYPNRKRGYERFLSLGVLFGISDRFIDKTEQLTEKVLGESIDFELINKIISDEKEKALQWIGDALGNTNTGRTAKLPEKAIVSFIEKTDCMGCGACACVCPVDAISLQADEFGYYRSNISYDKCIDCGKCSSVCPALHLPKNKNKEEPDCFAFIAEDKQVLYNSSSGGIFALLAEEAFKRNGCVAGAAWRDDFSVEHIVIDDSQKLYKLQKTKYLQSYQGKIFRDIKELLASNRFVLFSGCPCQITGLKSYLGKDYQNLILVDLLCSYAPSNMFFQKYIADAFPNGIENYQFRHKVQGWNTDCSTLTVTETGCDSQVRRGGSEDAYQRVFHNHTMCPTHCENCKYQRVPRFGDISIGDFWGLSNKDPQIDTKNGVSVVLCNNKNGEKFLESIPSASTRLMKKVPLQWLGRNGYAINDSHNYCSPQRDAFYKAIQTMSFEKAVNYALKPNHGRYPDVFEKSNAPLQFASSYAEFQYDSSFWEEHTINGLIYLMVKPGMSKPGRYAVMPLCQLLDKNSEYLIAIRFRIKTSSTVINFHIKDSGTKYYQVICSHEIQEDYNSQDWIEIESKFKPNSNIYDEFMVGAAHVKGADNYICFDYINIRKLS